MLCSFESAWGSPCRGQVPGTDSPHICCLWQNLGITQSHSPANQSANRINQEHLPCFLAKAPPGKGDEGWDRRIRLPEAKPDHHSKYIHAETISVQVCHKHPCVPQSPFDWVTIQIDPNKKQETSFFASSKPQQARGRTARSAFCGRITAAAQIQPPP